MSVLGLYFLYKVFFESCYFSADRFDRLVVRGFADLAISWCRNVYGLGPRAAHGNYRWRSSDGGVSGEGEKQLVEGSVVEPEP
jgi:hypothetical protein